MKVASTSTGALYRSDSPGETMTIGRRLAERHPEGAIYYLDGDLGAGKTIFAKGIATGYDVEPDRVVSPTFALVNRYSGGSQIIYHIDLYRIENERELAELGLGELEGEGAVLVVEWPEKLGTYRRPDAVLVRLELLDDETRQIRITEP